MADPLPEKIGRYLILSLLGEGGFGQVYLALDSHLDREVALKVSTEGRRELLEALEAQFDEARALASLDHPNIVTVHDTGRTEDGSVFLVSKYIRGTTLRERVAEAPLSHEESARLVLQTAQALGHAHSKGFVHRDIKPGNIMLAEDGKPVLIDFGIALAEENWGRVWEKNVGTPRYMSPEQARGEGHLVDARSDIFSLGVVFYELLTRHSAYEGTTREKASRTIDADCLFPPRVLDAAVPRELERICLRCLAKRPSDRYQSTEELQLDLDAFLARRKAAAADEAAQIVPKGLRSFGPEDSSFFLKLLPGPTDREGLPESIRFWKSRIEERDPNRTFRIGLLYGPSGSGKSSLVKAALLPRLSPDVRSIFLEASQEDTAERLFEALRREFPKRLEAAEDLTTAMRRLRLDRDPSKVLIVIDQFEQWLHARAKQPERMLINALRQCDGESLQCLLLVRDDFWLPISRLMHDLQEEILTNRNAAAVDLFEPEHAEKVLAEFGRAYGRLPQTASLGREATRLLNEAIGQLGDPVNGKVVPVQLALFAEMFKTREWSITSLRRVGGAQGIGVNFLEEHLGGRGSDRRRSKRQIAAARKILAALLPEDQASIKGPKVSEAVLQKQTGAAGEIDREVIQWLDNELRLITPVSRASEADANAGDEQRAYQLTHDFLVPTVRSWLNARKRKTRRGRAELCLTERADAWKHRRERRDLPTLRETMNIHLFTKPANWSPTQAQMMKSARKASLETTGLWSLLLVCLLAVGLGVWNAFDQSEANVLVGSIQQIDTARLSDLFPRIEPLWEEVEPQLRGRVEGLDGHVAYDVGSKAWLNASLIMHHFNPSQASLERLHRHLLEAPPGEFHCIFESVRPQFARIRPALEKLADDPDITGPGPQLRALLALALQPDADLSGNEWEERAQTLLRHATSLDLEELAAWVGVCGKTHAAQTVALFESALEKPPLRAEDDPFVETQLRGRAILTLCRLGHRRELLWDALAIDEAVPLRSHLVNHLALFGIAPDLLVQRLAQAVEDDPLAAGEGTRPLVANLLLSLGDYERIRFKPEAFDQYRVLLDVCAHSNIPSWRSAAKWSLRRFGLPQPAVPPERKHDLSKNWYFIADSGNDEVGVPEIEMVRIPAPGHFSSRKRWSSPERGLELVDVPQHIPYDYFLSATEITQGQWRQYRPDHEEVLYNPGGASRDDWPVSMVSVYDAMHFCNELSAKEKLEPFYIVPEGPKPQDPIIRGDPTKHEGYRLPTKEEWWYAAYAKFDMECYTGSAFPLLLSYGWVDDNSDGHPHPVGTNKPDDFGNFDMLGNISEWIDEFVGDRFLNSSSFNYTSTFGMPTTVWGQFPGHTRHQTAGLRVARTRLNGTE